MSHFSRYSLSSSVKLAFCLSLLAGTGCAARPVAPPATPPAAVDEAALAESGASGVAEPQPPPAGEDFVFVLKERKTASSADDEMPATSLQADQSARKQRIAK